MKFTKVESGHKRKQVCANICIGKCRDMLNKFMIVNYYDWVCS